MISKALPKSLKFIIIQAISLTPLLKIDEPEFASKLVLCFSSVNQFNGSWMALHGLEKKFWEQIQDPQLRGRGLVNFVPAKNPTLTSVIESACNQISSSFADDVARSVHLAQIASCKPTRLRSSRYRQSRRAVCMRGNMCRTRANRDLLRCRGSKEITAFNFKFNLTKYLTSVTPTNRIVMLIRRVEGEDRGLRCYHT